MSQHLIPGFGPARPLVADRTDISTGGHRMYEFVVAHGRGHNGHLQWSIRELAAGMGCSRRTVCRRIRELRLAGVLMVTRTGDASHYYLAQTMEQMARFNRAARAYYKRITLKWTRIMERRTAVEIARQEALERIIVVGPGEVIDPTPDAENYLPVEPPEFFSEGDVPSVTPNTDIPLRPGSSAWQTARLEARAAWAKLIQRE